MLCTLNLRRVTGELSAAFTTGAVARLLTAVSTIWLAQQSARHVVIEVSKMSEGKSPVQGCGIAPLWVVTPNAPVISQKLEAGCPLVAARVQYKQRGGVAEKPVNFYKVVDWRASCAPRELDCDV